MTAAYAKDLWDRAINAMRSAEALLGVSPDDAASRAYYAALDAVSAGFALEGRTFKKHTEVRAAVHRDWVQTGLWPKETGSTFDTLWELRDIGDYGGAEHVEKNDAEDAIKTARNILRIVGEKHPELAPLT